jgi:glycosyltransferase involved in cell wall biosynthesis
MPASEDPVSKPQLVSVLIPAFNVERWIRQSIESALNQTYRPIEVVVVDDGSSDQTVREIERFGNAITLFRSEHAGGNAARNQLLHAANGSWLQYLDSDDYLLPGKIAQQMELIAQEPALDVVCSPVILRHEEKQTEQLLPFDDPPDMITEYIRWGAVNTNGFLFRRSALLEVGGWNESQIACQEHELLLRLLLKGRRVRCLSEPGAVYRMHGLSTVSRKDPLRTARLQVDLLNQIDDYLSRSGRLSGEYRRALYISRMETARKTWSVDRVFSHSLASRAVAHGRVWRASSPALPPIYQIIRNLFGFSAAEFVASCQRSMGAARSSQKS